MPQIRQEKGDPCSRQTSSGSRASAIVEAVRGSAPHVSVTGEAHNYA